MPARSKTVEFQEVLEFRKREARRRGGEVVIDERSGEIGEYNNYYHDNKVYSGNLYLIYAETYDGYANYIYDNYGRSIATLRMKNGIRDFRIDSNVRINEVLLRKQIQEGIENIERNLEDTENGSSQGGEGRDKTKDNKKQEQGDEKRKNKKRKDSSIEGQGNTLKNLKDFGISLERESTRISLRTKVNGYYLWQILIDDRLKRRLPKGMDERTFKYGYLTVIDSNKLEKIDGKKRTLEKTLAITSYDEKTIIELDEETLIPQPKLDRYTQQKVEKATNNFRDGKEVAGPESYLFNSQKASYKIPKNSTNFHVAEDWYLDIDLNQNIVRGKRLPINENRDEISFVQRTTQVSEQASEIEKAKRGRIVTKLEDERKEKRINSEERKQQEGLKNRETNEALNVRNEHLKEIAQRILDCECKFENDFLAQKQSEIGKDKMHENYNYGQILERVKQLHNEGMRDEDIEKKIFIEAYSKVGENENAKVHELGPTDIKHAG